VDKTFKDELGMSDSDLIKWMNYYADRKTVYGQVTVIMYQIELAKREIINTFKDKK
jgi:hypothetical protein